MRHLHRDGAPANWKDCATDSECMRWLWRQLLLSKVQTHLLSDRAKNSRDRVTVRAAVHEVETAGGILHAGGGLDRLSRAELHALRVEVNRRLDAPRVEVSGYDRTCPVCNAAIGEPCTFVGTGARMRRVHDERGEFTPAGDGLDGARALGLALGAPLADDECAECGRVPYAEGHEAGCAVAANATETPAAIPSTSFGVVLAVGAIRTVVSTHDTAREARAERRALETTNPGLDYRMVERIGSYRVGDTWNTED